MNTMNNTFGNLFGAKKSEGESLPSSNPISQDDKLENLDGIARDVVEIKNLFRAKLEEISNAINQDADKINGYVEKIEGIIGNNNSAKGKIKELKELMEKYSEDKSYKTSKENMESAMTALDKSINSNETVDTATAEGTNQTISQFLATNLEKLLNDKNITELNSEQKRILKNPTGSSIDKINATNFPPPLNITVLQDIRKELITNASNQGYKNMQAGGYLSTPRRRKRNMKSNSTRNFFKFTSKRGVKKANKKSRKKRKY